jgi:signal transduction histidine kinase
LDGLAAAVEEILSRSQVSVTAELLEDRLAPELEATAYFLIAEALTNVAKHSRARCVEVRTWLEERAVWTRCVDGAISQAVASVHSRDLTDYYLARAHRSHLVATADIAASGERIR